MKLEEIEAAVLNLDTRARARIAEKLLASLEDLSDEEKLRLWAEEAEWRDAEEDTDPTCARPGTDVLREARLRLT
jgi:hypothetical protein